MELLHLAIPVPVERIRDTPVQFQPLLAPSSDSLPAIQDECVGVGFGKHENEDGTTTKGIKRSCTMSVVSANPDLIEMQLVTGIPDNHDSGGPLICNGNVAAVVRSHLGQWPDYNREMYTTVDTPWIEETIANYRGRVEPPTRPSTATIHVVANEGALCPEGSLYMRGNTLVADQSTAPPSSSELLRCSIDLALELPSDRKLDRVQMCPYFELYDLEAATAVAFDYAVDGITVYNEPIEVGALADVEGACRTVRVNAATCGARASVPIHIELAAQIPSATPFRFVSLDHMVEGSEGSTWSSCTAAPN
jgi:hypothetical protein